MHKIFNILLIGGFICSLFATDARVLTMGRHDNFFMDDISIFRNPANINIYPNMLMGSFGYYAEDPLQDDTSNLGGLRKKNRDPQKPFFGGILSLSLDKTSDAGDQFPLLSMGVVINRHDEMLKYLDPSDKDFVGIGDTSLNGQLNENNFIEPVGKFDIMFGYATKNGGMFGFGTYFAFQKEKEGDNVNKEVKLIKGNLGVNLPVAKTVDLEFSANIGVISQVGMDSTLEKVNVFKNDFFASADLRLFSAISFLNGSFVPHMRFDYMKFNDGKNRRYNLDAGVALNVNIDRGFFWTGIEGIYRDIDSKMTEAYDKVQTIGLRVNFGMESNIIFDWLVARVGATKLLAIEAVGGLNGTRRWIENPENDASDEDHFAFGFGFNIENRFKFDFVLAEDIFYTLTNLFSGNHHHLMTRFTLTYSF